MSSSKDLQVTIEGWRFSPVRAGWWVAIDPAGRECGRGGLRQMVFRALGRLPRNDELGPASA